MPRLKASIKKYGELIERLIKEDAPDQEILALLQDEKLRTFDRAAMDAIASFDLQKVQSRTSWLVYKRALHTFASSPRGKLVRHIKCLPLSRQFRLALNNAEVQGWLLEELKGVDNKQRVQLETESQIRAFMRQSSDLLFPIPRLVLRFIPENGRIVMIIEMKPDSKLHEAFKKKEVYSSIVTWRERLTDFETERAKVSGRKLDLPRKEQVSLDLYLSSRSGGGKRVTKRFVRI
jgi:hypothetical protein